MGEVSYSVEPWSDLFVGSAGAGAALAGLVFVSVSINIDRILALPGVPDRALGTVLLLLNVVVMSVFGLAPGQSTTALGLELLLAGAVVSIGVGTLFGRSEASAQRPPASVWFNRVIAALGTWPFAIAGASLLLEAGGGLYWVLAGIVAALVGAVLNAWVLLVEILR